MKKIITLALCMASVGAISAQKSVVDQAAKLSGKNAQIEEARKLIQEAAANPETQNDARTYYVAGKIEFDAFDNSFKKQMIDPNSVNLVEMGGQLINGYNQFIKAMSLDSVPNAKGEIKPKYSKEIASKISGHFNDYFNAGGTFYNEQKFYPEAYEAFMIYGAMPKQPFASKEVKGKRSRRRNRHRPRLSDRGFHVRHILGAPQLPRLRKRTRNQRPPTRREGLKHCRADRSIRTKPTTRALYERVLTRRW